MHLLRNSLKACITLPLLSTAGVYAEDAKLQGYAADITQTSVSGLSSGAFMTAQFHVIHSGTLVGAGVIAGGPYYCSGSYESNSYLDNAMNTCMNPIGLGPDSEALYAEARKVAAQNLIDNVDNLKDDKVYIFSGANDKTVTPKVVEQTYKFYRLAGLPKKNIKFSKYVNAGHAVITDNDKDVACSDTNPPFINDCDFFQSHDILEHIYGDLNEAAETLSGKIIAFDQSEFIESDRSSMSKTAYVYVPAACESETCKVHIVFHGCEQGAAVIGDKYYRTTGYNELADTNKMIVLYPQAEPSDSIPFNPKGCWDFWGYSSPDPENPDFYTHDAPQSKAVMGMLKRLAEPRAE